MSPPPSRILPALSWSFGSARYASPEALSDALRRYQLDIHEEDRWNPDALVLATPRVIIQFEAWRGDSEIEPDFELSAAGPEGFTALDLMYGVVTGIARVCDEQGADLGDHHFFEGLILSQPGPPPVYHVRCGS